MITASISPVRQTHALAHSHTNPASALGNFRNSNTHDSIRPLDLIKSIKYSYDLNDATILHPKNHFQTVSCARAYVCVCLCSQTLNYFSLLFIMLGIEAIFRASRVCTCECGDLSTFYR